jgi:hypothetical protein
VRGIKKLCKRILPEQEEFSFFFHVFIGLPNATHCFSDGEKRSPENRRSAFHPRPLTFQPFGFTPMPHLESVMVFSVKMRRHVTKEERA